MRGSGCRWECRGGTQPCVEEGRQELSAGRWGVTELGPNKDCRSPGPGPGRVFLAEEGPGEAGGTEGASPHTPLSDFRIRVLWGK